MTVNLDEDGDGVGEVATGDKADCAWPAKHRQTLFVVGHDDVGNDAEAVHDDDDDGWGRNLFHRCHIFSAQALAGC